LISLDTAATEVFQILRSYDYAVMMYDDDGNQVYKPEETRRFFAKPENLLVSLVEDGDNSSIRLYLGKSTDISDVLSLDQTLRRTATKYNMIFNVKRYGRDLQPADFATKASVTEDKKEETMNILEGMYGTTRSSYLKLENARMIVRHSKKIDEMVMGSRGRHIDAIFVENAVGERFLFPTRQLSPARAMTQHVNQGGGFADMVGQQITRMANDYANLGAASGHIAANSNMLGESAQAVRQTCRTQMHEMRKCFERLARANNPEKWAAFAEAVEAKCDTLNEGEEVAIDITEVRDMLTVEGTELDESVLTTVAEALKSAEIDEGASNEIKEPKCRECGGKGLVNGDADVCPSCAGSGVDSVVIVGRPVSKEAWDELKNGHIELYHPVANDDSEPRFTSRAAYLAFKLGKIVPEIKSDSLVNFLSYVADQLQSGHNDPSRAKSLERIAMHTITIATPRDEMAVKSESVEAYREFTEWMDSTSPSRVLAEHDPDDHDYGYEATDDQIEGDAEQVANDFEPEDFLKSCGEDFHWGTAEAPEEKEFDKSFIVGLLTRYLDKKVEEATGREGDVYDMSEFAESLFDRVEPMLSEAGYKLSEGELSREDMVIPTNQGEDLKREVTKSTSTDPVTGEQIPADTDYIGRIRTLAGMPWNR
jgi:predicted Zn-ribbon and HTH transcriptional regulator